MDEIIKDLYVNKGILVADISKKLNVSVQYIYDSLYRSGYLIKRGKKRDIILKAKKAYDYYKDNPKVSITETSRKFNISEDTLAGYLKEYGIETNRKWNAYLFNEHIFDIIDTEEKAYWLGFLYADGNLSSSPLKNIKNKKYIVEICLALIDTGHLFKFENFLNIEKSKVRVYDYKDVKGEIKQHCKFGICNKHLWESLYNNGCIPNKSLVLKYPSNIINAELQRHFLRGYFDGDGSFGAYRTKRQTHDELGLSCVGTKDMLENLFKKFDCHFYHHKNHSDETLTMNATTKTAKQILDYMYKDSTIYLDRKFNLYLNICRRWDDNNGILNHFK